MADEASKPLSFGFTKKRESKQLINTGKGVLGNEHGIEKEEEKDFLHSAERNSLKSVKPKEEAKELVIPLMKKNRWILPTVEGLDKQAMEEVIKEAQKDLQSKESEEGDLTIPILMRNKLPDISGSDKDAVKMDIALRPEPTTLEEYEAMPVSAFGAAMLRGMGWKKGQAIGGSVKGLAEPIEYIPRSKGLGLGAEVRAEMPSKRRRKPGDKDQKHSGPIVGKDGRVRHVKGVGEEVKPSEPLDYRVGTCAVIGRGAHKDLHGKIISVDVDNSRVTVSLHISNENITLHQYHVRLIDKDEYKELCQEGKSRSKSNKDKESSKDRDNSHRSTKRRKEENTHEKSSGSYKQKSKHDKSEVNGEKKKKCWLHPELRVRIISKDYKKGRYYNTKVKVVDVISRNECDCETEDGKLLEGVKQSMLETVVPKKQDAYIRIVRGPSKGQLATIMQRDTSQSEAIIQLLLDKSIETYPYDDICEHLGSIREDLM
ncbi:predicted protein [Nematostella vectensis]|uniref:G-patch domain-containing protein n=1 Tax=Nematostella vectensis TaxID=45351 RepID=A7RK31_NEMVE|nr:predicted protein [Nematostella vectensis]|eukprot:XP_001640241.1 predicted protein [Nematostella vectensis]